ncbi:MAG: WXG100 family type VII secretion target [Anaerolineae bacterium]|jgi:uncharacterized protein YukE|nr:WXG100 family type VII secretion target [Anaerolineae bacterium]
MSGELLARIQQMREAAATLRGSAARMGDCIDGVEAEIRALGVERFTSLAAESFRSDYQRLTPILREAAHKLERFHEKLIAAADEIEVASRPTT